MTIFSKENQMKINVKELLKKKKQLMFTILALQYVLRIPHFHSVDIFPLKIKHVQ